VCNSRSPWYVTFVTLLGRSSASVHQTKIQTSLMQPMTKTREKFDAVLRKKAIYDRNDRIHWTLEVLYKTDGTRNYRLHLERGFVAAEETQSELAIELRRLSTL